MLDLGSLRVICIARGPFYSVFLPLPAPPCCWNGCDCYPLRWPGKLRLFTTSSLTSWGRLQNSQPSGRSIFNISFRCWSKENDDNFKALLGGNDLRGTVDSWRSQIRRPPWAQWWRRSVESNGECVPEFHKSPSSGIYQCVPGICCNEPLYSSHKTNECLIISCLAFVDMEVIHSDIRGKSIMPLFGLPDEEPRLHVGITLFPTRLKRLCQWCCICIFASLLLGEIVLRLFRSQVYRFTVFVTDPSLPVCPSGRAWPCLGQQNLSKILVA